MLRNRLFALFLVSFLFDYNGGFLRILLTGSGNSIHSVQLILGIIGFILVFNYKQFIQNIKINKQQLLLLLLLILYFQINKAANSPNYSTYKIQLLWWNYMLILIVINTVRNLKDLKWFILFGTFQIIVGILSQGIDFLSYRTGAGEPIIAGRLGGILLCFAFYYSDNKLQAYRIITGVLGLIIILLSGTRTVIVSFAIILIIMMFLDPRDGQFQLKKQFIKSIVGTLLVIVLIVFTIKINLFRVNSLLIERFFDSFIAVFNFQEHSGSTIERVLEWEIAINTWQQNLTFGVGLGGYGFNFFGLDGRMYPHNIILELLAEGGLIALILFVFFVYVLWKSIKSSLPYFPISTNKFIISLFFLGLLSSFSSLEISNQFILFLSSGLILTANSIKENIKKRKTLI